MTEKLREKSKSAIAVALEENLVNQVHYYGKSPQVNLYDDKNNMVRIRTGLPISTLNLIAGAKLTEYNIEQKIDFALAPFKKRKIPAIWWVGPTTTPKNLGIHLENNGLEKLFDMPGMYYDLDKLERKSEFPAEFTFKQVDNEKSLRIWAETQTKGFEADKSYTQYIYEFEKTLGTDPNSPWLRYIGFIAEEPVGVSILFLGAGVAAIFNVATVPEYRRRGIGTFITKVPLLKARSLGYKYGVLKASPMGVHLYRKMEFGECCKIGLYHFS